MRRSYFCLAVGYGPLSSFKLFQHCARLLAARMVLAGRRYPQAAEWVFESQLSRRGLRTAPFAAIHAVLAADRNIVSLWAGDPRSCRQVPTAGPAWLLCSHQVLKDCLRWLVARKDDLHVPNMDGLGNPGSYLEIADQKGTRFQNECACSRINLHIDRIKWRSNIMKCSAV